jgi:ribosomal protein S18 acetylase RimI-like enzyme
MPLGDRISYETFSEARVRGVVSLCSSLEWPSYSDRQTVSQAFTASGAISWVALDGDEVVGLAHLLTNGVVHAHLSLVGVRETHRRRGIARQLIGEAFRVSGAKWIDLGAESGSEEFYRSFVHAEGRAFRIYPFEPPDTEDR